MGFGRNQNERIIARRIQDLQSRLSYHFNKWHELDMKKNILIKKLGGKYKTKKWDMGNGQRSKQ